MKLRKFAESTSRGFLWAITSIWIASSITACAAEKIRQNSDVIRESLLQKLPLGSHLESAKIMLAAQDYKYRENNTGFLKQEAPKSTVVGVYSLVAPLGSYWKLPLMRISVTAYFGFDSKQELVDIWIWKTADAP